MEHTTKTIKTISRNGVCYWKHTPEKYKELHLKNYSKKKYAACRNNFMKYMLRCKKTPKDKTLETYMPLSDEIQHICDTRIGLEPITDKHPEIQAFYQKIIQRVNELKALRLKST